MSGGDEIDSCTQVLALRHVWLRVHMSGRAKH
jgi:hypothetical protein